METKFLKFMLESVNLYSDKAKKYLDTDPLLASAMAKISAIWANTAIRYVDERT